MSRPKPPKKPPKWQASVDNMSPWYAMGLAPLLQPWGVIGAGAATIVSAKLASAADYVTLVLFGLIASASYITMETYAGFRPEKSQELLAGLRKWIDIHTDQAIIVGSLVVGFWLIGHSAYLIVTA
jgi:Sap, sulfolipid-1-addressing protein